MVATFGKPRFAKNPNIVYELLRLCSAKGTQVVGGASKLLAYFKQHYMTQGNVLVSYCNRRYSVGKVYHSLGFTLSHVAPPSFFYINSAGNYAGTRYQWQQHLMADKLANFDSNITADQNMLNN